MTVLTQAMYHARELAIDRMEDEAWSLFAQALDLLERDGVIAHWAWQAGTDTQARDRFTAWLARTVLITPPPVIVEHYAGLAARATRHRVRPGRARRGVAQGRAR
jgi:hypothetical protein